MYCIPYIPLYTSHSRGAETYLDANLLFDVVFRDLLWQNGGEMKGAVCQV